MPRLLFAALARWFLRHLTPCEAEGCLGWLDTRLAGFAG